MTSTEKYREKICKDSASNVRISGPELPHMPPEQHIYEIHKNRWSNKRIHWSTMVSTSPAPPDGSYGASPAAQPRGRRGPPSGAASHPEGPL